MVTETRPAQTNIINQFVHQEPEHLKATQSLWKEANPEPKNPYSTQWQLWQSERLALLSRIQTSLTDGTFLEKTPEELVFGPQEDLNK